MQVVCVFFAHLNANISSQIAGWLFVKKNWTQVGPQSVHSLSSRGSNLPLDERKQDVLFSTFPYHVFITAHINTLIPIFGNFLHFGFSKPLMRGGVETMKMYGVWCILCCNVFFKPVFPSLLEKTFSRLKAPDILRLMLKLHIKM